MKYVAIVGILIALLAIIIAGPLLTIASLNTLFGLNIAYTVWTWLSVAWLQMATFGSLSWSIWSINSLK